MDQKIYFNDQVVKNMTKTWRKNIISHSHPPNANPPRNKALIIKGL